MLIISSVENGIIAKNLRFEKHFLEKIFRIRYDYGRSKEIRGKEARDAVDREL